MRGVQLELNVAGTLAIDWPARPASAKISVTKPDGQALPSPVSAATATVDSVSTTLSATPTYASGLATLALASVTGIVAGRQYLISGANGSENCRVKGIDTVAKTVTLYAIPLLTVASGYTFVSTRTTYALASTQQAETGQGYIAVWTATYADATTERRTMLYDVVRSKPYNPCSVAGFRSWRPGLVGEAEIKALERVSSLQAIIDQAFEDVLSHIESGGNSSAAIIDWSSFENAIYAQALLNLVDSGLRSSNRDESPASTLEQRRLVRDRELDAAMRNVKWYDENQDGKQEETEKAIKINSMRMVL
jgi:hypothetical protein